MDTFRSRLPKNRDIALAFAACVFPVHVWSILRMLNEVPSWALRLTIGELVGAVAYTLTFTLLESVMLLLILLVLCFVLPARALRDRFVAQSTMAVFLMSAGAIAAHYDLLHFGPGQRKSLAWLLLYFAATGALLMLVHQSIRFERFVNSVVERLAPLSYAYVVVDLLGVAVVILRNIVGSFA